jgi:hypothetical protein
MARYRLEIEPLDLGADVRAVGLELTETMRGEPTRGAEAARIWSRVLPALAAGEPWALDFFSHLGRVRAYCQAHGIAYREAAARLLVVHDPALEETELLFARFEGELFGARAGELLTTGDAALEGELSRRGADAYHPVFGNYFFCAVCDFSRGALTLLSRHILPSEVVRRLGPVVRELDVEPVLPVS